MVFGKQSNKPNATNESEDTDQDAVGEVATAEEAPKSANQTRVDELNKRKTAGEQLTDAEQAELKALERNLNDEVNDPPTPGN